MLHFLLEIIIMTRSTKTRLLLRDKCKVVHSDRLYRPGKYIQMCTPKIISSFSPQIRIIIIKTSVTLLLFNGLSVCTRQTDCQLSVHTNIITVYCNLGNSIADFNLSGST